MKASKTIAIAIVLAFLTGTVRADRTLGQSEISQILQDLTSRPMKTWISSGTISASHEQYWAPKTTDADEINNAIDKAIQEHQNDADTSQVSADILKMKLDAIPFNVRYEMSDEYTMGTTETVKYDGSRFYWEIDVSSRKDSVKPGPELAGNYMTNEFDLADNGRRAFTWDGSKYTLYSESKNNAFVDAAGKLPRAVNGPLTAGIIPWGYGEYSYSNLVTLKTSAVEQLINGRTEIDLTLERPNGTRMLFVLDADNDYAVISYSNEGLNKTVSKQYGDYRLIGGVAVPRTIEIEKYDTATNRLLSTDSWSIASIDTGSLSTGDFTINYKEGAQIEYSSILAKTTMFRYSPRLDTDLLLAERLSYAASPDKSTQNCATAALRYATLKLGRNVPESQLAGLVDPKTRLTSLAAMMGFVHRQGLYSRAVRTDIKKLQQLTDCQVILHIPHRNHFVLLGDIDSEFIWTIDLAGRKFCSRADVAFFGMDWTQGTALLISDKPIEGSFNDINQSALQNINGGTGYTCTSLIQEYYYIPCYYDDYLGVCPNDYYRYYPERWGCEQATSGMCIEDYKLRLAKCLCILNEQETDCAVDGNWKFSYVPACY